MYKCLYNTKHEKNTLLVVILIIVVLGLLLTYFSFAKEKPITQQTTRDNYYQGTVSTGNEIDRDYCSEGVYFTTQGKAYLLRKNTPDKELIKVTDIDVNTTSLELKFPPKDTNYCEALMCDCEEYAVVLSELSEASDYTSDNGSATEWETYTHPGKYSFTIEYPVGTQVSTPNGFDTSVSFLLPDLYGNISAYPQLDIEIAENPENLILEEFVPYLLEVKTGEDRASVAAHLHMADDRVGNTYALRVTMDGNWWQGSGAKTIHLIPISEGYIVISSMLQEGAMDDKGNFTFTDTPYSKPYIPTIKQMLDSFSL